MHSPRRVGRGRLLARHIGALSDPTVPTRPFLPLRRDRANGADGFERQGSRAASPYCAAASCSDSFLIAASASAFSASSFCGRGAVTASAPPGAGSPRRDERAQHRRWRLKSRHMMQAAPAADASSKGGASANVATRRTNVTPNMQHKSGHVATERLLGERVPSSTPRADPCACARAPTAAG